MRITNKMPSVTNVAPGSKAVLNLPLGRTYDLLQLEYAGVTLAQIKNLELEINGKVVQRFRDGVQLADLNSYWGRPVDSTGLLTMWFVRPEFNTLVDQRLTALGTVDIKTLALKFDIDAAADAPVLEAYAVQSEPQPLGLITKVKSFQSSTAVSGLQEIDNIPTNAARIAAIHLFKADIEQVEVEINSMKAFELKKASAENIQKKYGRVPLTAKASHIDFVLEGDNAQAMVTQGIQDFRIKPVHTAAGNTELVVEYFDGLAGI
jgi:hypothetical protein